MAERISLDLEDVERLEPAAAVSIGLINRFLRPHHHDQPVGIDLAQNVGKRLEIFRSGREDLRYLPKNNLPNRDDPFVVSVSNHRSPSTSSGRTGGYLSLGDALY